MRVRETDSNERKAALALLMSYRLSQALKVMADLQLPELLAAGPRSAEDIAAESRCHARSLRRLLRALVAAGALTQAGDLVWAEGTIPV
jgi:orsellinic acid C2-O-methyltransferase